MAYYVSAKRRDRYALLIGPFRRHGDALAMVDAARGCIHDNRADTRREFSYGTCRDAREHGPGRLNVLLALELDAAGYVIPPARANELQCPRCSRSRVCFAGRYCSDCEAYRSRARFSDADYPADYDRAPAVSCSPRRARRAARVKGRAAAFVGNRRRKRTLSADPSDV